MPLQFKLTTHRENNGGLVMLYYANGAHAAFGTVDTLPNESEWIVPGTIDPSVN